MKQRDEVVEGIEASLGSTPQVSGAAYFGSLGSGRCDSFSDIDLVVRCAMQAANDVISRLHAALGIVLFRPFSEDRRPGGRYWFSAANPFVRLDVSFYEAPEFDEILVTGRGFAQPPFRSIALHRVSDDNIPPAALPGWSQLDHDFAGALRQFHESAKKVARGLPPKRPLLDAEKALRQFQSQNLRPEVWDLYERSLMHLRLTSTAGGNSI